MEKLVFFAGADFALPSLKTLLGEYELVVVSTSPKPAGRGLRLVPSPAAAFAMERGLPLRTPPKLTDGEFLRWLEGQNAKAFVVIAYGRKLPKEVLRLAHAINFHGSLLPRWRGASPIVQAILHRDRQTGVTAILMNERIDEGEIINMAKIPLERTADFASLHDRLSRLCAEMIIDTLQGFFAGRHKPIPQPTTGATAAGLLKVADMRLDWRRDSLSLERMVRAFSPSPGAWGEVGGLRCKVLEARSHRRFRGVVGELRPHSGIIGCGEGGLEIITLKPPNKRAMGFHEFWRGLRQ